MNPSDTNCEYEQFKYVWRMCRDVVIGQRAIHARGETYLPKLSGQDETAYCSYKDRAYFYNACGRTVKGMRGLVFRKKPVISVPAAMEKYLDDITMTGISLEGLAKSALDNTIAVGRHGLLVDMPKPPVTGAGRTTLAQASKLAIRPYLVPFKAEEILNWQYGRVGSQTVLVNVFLQEPVEKNDDYDAQIRQLTIENGVYVQYLWRQMKSGSATGWQVVETVVPKMNGNPLPYIPFWFIAPEETDGCIVPPPIEDLAYVNISHYRNVADHENGLHISGLPTPYITGVEPDPEGKVGLNIGSNTAWLIPNENATVGFVQVGADGFTALEKALDRKEQQMAALGARMIAPEKKGVETADAASIRRGGENSVLADITATVSNTIEAALKFAAEWDGLNPNDVKFELNKDFLPTPMTAQELTAWVGALQSGSVSERTFFDALQAGEAISESTTFEDEQQFKEESAPPTGTINDNQP